MEKTIIIKKIYTPTAGFLSSDDVWYNYKHSKDEDKMKIIKGQFAALKEGDTLTFEGDEYKGKFYYLSFEKSGGEKTAPETKYEPNAYSKNQIETRNSIELQTCVKAVARVFQGKGLNAADLSNMAIDIRDYVFGGKEIPETLTKKIAESDFGKDPHGNKIGEIKI